MKLSLRMLAVLLLVVLALPLILLTSCGSDKPSNATTAPATGSITINPDSIEFGVAAVGGVCDGALTDYVKRPVVVTVLDANGNPQNDTTIYIHLDYTRTTASLRLATRLFDADFDPPVEVDVPYETKTGAHGTKNLEVWLDSSGCEYTGVLQATSSSLIGTMEFDVAAL